MTRDETDETLPATHDAVKLESADTVAPSTQSTVDATLPAAVVRAADDYVALTEMDRRHYVIGRELARGGMGRISTARDRRLARPVAIKELLVDAADLRVRFEREARITAKLQHPSIVQIHEAGVWPSGEPFYVMQLVSGQPLDRAIAKQSTLAGRLGLLSNVIAVADALAYAHSQRVIHRDLKPANVLVGEFGETVVIDWGLAKDLATPGEDDGSASPTRTPGADETRAGAVMGTPAFMPVEQARGDVVDERADVYAIGAILYFLLAGAPPYRGATSDAVLDAVLHEPPAPIAELVPDAPRELVAIVDKALARAVADRYPTANQLASDLRKFQTGQLVGAHRYTTWQLMGRWIRRHRAAVSVASVAAVILVIASVVGIRRILEEQQQTEGQRSQAETNRGQAEDLLGFMLTDLRDKLQPLGRLDLLETVADKAVAYYDARGKIVDTQEWSKRALVRRYTSDIDLDRGKLERAEAGYRAALAQYLALTVLRPSAKTFGGVGDVRERLGGALRAAGKHDEALAQLEAALIARDQAVALEPDNEAAQGAVAAAHGKLGRILRSRGDDRAALARFRTALTLTEPWAARKPEDDARQNNLFVIQSDLAELSYSLGDTAAALEMHRKALALVRALTAKSPTDANHQRNVMIALADLGFILQNTGAFDEALSMYQDAVVIAERLSSADPTNADRRRDIVGARISLGELLRLRNRTAESLVQFRQAVAIADQLVAASPTDHTSRFALADARRNLARALDQHDDVPDAAREYDLSSKLYEAVLKDEPGNSYYQALLADIYGQRGSFRVRRQQLALALEDLGRALAMHTKIAAGAPDDPGPKAAMQRWHELLGDTHLALRHHREALASYATSLALINELVSIDSTNLQLQQAFASMHGKLGDASAATGDRAAARKAYERALALLAPLAGGDDVYAREETQQITAKLQRLGK